MNRYQLADYIHEKLARKEDELRTFYQSSGKVSYFFVDDLLPENVVAEIHDAFPEGKSMMLKKSLREYKYVAAQMNKYNAILEEIVYAFQQTKVVGLIESIVGVKNLLPDDNLYAGGVSSMGEGHYLNPHLDNSHDKDRVNWRAFNLLYYVTPDWKLENGGNLELWPGGPKAENERVTIESKYNRLVVMITHGESWHSVSPIKVKRERRCVSNYYFSASPMKASDSFHVTSFRGRPEQKLRDLVLRFDIAARSALRKVFKSGIKENPHVYKK